MRIEDSINSFYRHLLVKDSENKLNWTLHQNGMCNSESRNPDECFSMWILVKKHYVEVLALIEGKSDEQATECADDFTKYLMANNITGLERMDNTVDPVKFRSKRRNRWVVSRQWTESPLECYDWAVNEYYNYLNLLTDFN